MFDYKFVVSKLNEALALVSDRLSDTQIKFIRSYIYSGEWNLALETLCDIISEYELPLNPKVYQLFQEVGSNLDLDQETWEMVKPYVIQ